MKKLLSLMLALSLLLLAGCGGAPAETEPPTTAAPTTEAPTVATTEAPETTAAPTTEPTEPPVVYTNPLTGETLDAPLENRIFAVTINNVKKAIPHYGVNNADLYFEMFINDYSTRGFALYTDITDTAIIGSVRSMRMNFTDICQAYDAVGIFAGGSDKVLGDMYKTDIDYISVGQIAGDYYFRDQQRRDDGYAYEHTLFVKGPELKATAEKNDIRVTQDADKDYGLLFTENAAPENGEDASVINIDMNYKGKITKTNVLTYNAETGKYEYTQYKKPMVDELTGQPEAFKNIIVMLAEVKDIDVYHVANLQTSGEGYFACDGKIIPILWNHESETAPFTYTLTDGTPLELGIGNSYICITPLESEIDWE